MPMAQLIITAVTVEGRTKSEVARDYGVSRYWVQQLVQRYEREGPIAGSGGRITHPDNHQNATMSQDTCQRCPETSQCAPGRNRTYDRQIRRLLLYPLSYGGRERAVGTSTASSRITVAPDHAADKSIGSCSQPG
jgi:transposase-like protein